MRTGTLKSWRDGGKEQRDRNPDLELGLPLSTSRSNSAAPNHTTHTPLLAGQLGWLGLDANSPSPAGRFLDLDCMRFSPCDCDSAPPFPPSAPPGGISTQQQYRHHHRPIWSIHLTFPLCLARPVVLSSFPLLLRFCTISLCLKSTRLTQDQSRLELLSLFSPTVHPLCQRTLLSNCLCYFPIVAPAVLGRCFSHPPGHPPLV